MDKDNTNQSAESLVNNTTDQENINFSDADFAEIINQQSSGLGSNRVTEVVGQWAMPTTVLLVLITCFSGFFLSETAFTPVVGMIAPVVMALIMVIRDASIGKDEDPSIKIREEERKERTAQYQHKKDIKLAKMGLDERLKNQQTNEQARQFDMFQSSSKEFVDLIKEMNAKITQQINKPKSTELAIGETKVVITDGNTKIDSKETTHPESVI